MSGRSDPEPDPDAGIGNGVGNGSRRVLAPPAFTPPGATMTPVSTVILVGFMGAGKSAVGRVLATLLETPFVDLDEEVERRLGTAIPEVFQRAGEGVFRAAERAALRAVLAGPPKVVAAGGGAWCEPDNRAAAGAAGALAVFLDVPWPVLWRRLEADAGGRPKLADHDATRDLLEARLADYRRAAVTVGVRADESAAAVAGRVRAALAEVACGT